MKSTFLGQEKKKYVLILMNFFNRSIIDVLKDRDKHTISSYLSSIPLQERKNVQYVSIDMNEYYRDVVRFYLKDATIIADSFRVVKQINSACWK